MVAEETFSIACVELYARLWSDLDAFAAADEARARDPLGPIALLRLELLILLDACQSPRWRAVLSGAQQLALRAVVTDVLAVLNRPLEGLTREVIAEVQDRLFEEIVRRCAVATEEHPQARRTGT